MPLEIEHRPSASPFIERVWRSRSSDVARMTAIATPRWSLVFWEQSGRMHGAVQGPESVAGCAPVPEEATFFGIDFVLGATMPRLPVGRLVGGHAEIPDVTRTSFWLDGATWHLPGYDYAEAFVGRLVREAVVVRDPLVAEVVHRLGYFDQSHLAHALSRFIGRTATSLRDGDGPSTSSRAR